MPIRSSDGIPVALHEEGRGLNGPFKNRASFERVEGEICPNSSAQGAGRRSESRGSVRACFRAMSTVRYVGMSRLPSESSLVGAVPAFRKGQRVGLLIF